MPASSELRETLELLACDESASETERSNARRLLDRMSGAMTAETSDGITESEVRLSGDPVEVSQKALRVASAISGMPVVLYHDDSGYRFVGFGGVPEELSSIVSEIQSCERDGWGWRMRVAWMGAAMDATLGSPGNLPSTMSDVRIAEHLRSRGMSSDKVHPRVVRDYVRHSKAASKLAKDLLFDEK